MAWSDYGYKIASSLSYLTFRFLWLTVVILPLPTLKPHILCSSHLWYAPRSDPIRSSRPRSDPIRSSRPRSDPIRSSPSSLRPYTLLTPSLRPYTLLTLLTQTLYLPFPYISNTLHTALYTTTTSPTTVLSRTQPSLFLVISISPSKASIDAW